MKFRIIILFLGSLGLLMPGAQAQDAGQAELPSAPSASPQQSRPQKAVSPAEQQPAPVPQASVQQTQVPGDPTKPAAVPPAEQNANDARQNQPPKAGTASTSSSPLGPGPSDDDSLATIRHTVNEVNVVFTVTDRHGHYVRDLKKENFKVVGNSKPATEIRSFHAEANLPLEVGLLVDASNSVRDRFKFEQQAATEVLNQTMLVKDDRPGVVGFEGKLKSRQDF